MCKQRKWTILKINERQKFHENISTIFYNWSSETYRKNLLQYDELSLLLNVDFYYFYRFFKIKVQTRECTWIYAYVYAVPIVNRSIFCTIKKNNQRNNVLKKRQNLNLKVKFQNFTECQYSIKILDFFKNKKSENSRFCRLFQIVNNLFLAIINKLYFQIIRTKLIG